MRIQTLSGTNIKGATFHDELAAGTLYHGDNFRGKTTRIEALQLALAGYVPGIAKTPRDIFDELASGTPMTVAVDYDGGRLHKSWREENGTVKFEEQQTLGAPILFPSVALDHSVFLGLSGPAQTRFLFGCAELKHCTVENLAKTITASVKNIKLEENSKESEAVIDELVKFITEGAGMNLAPTQEWLGSLAEKLRLKKNSAVASAERMAKTGQGLAQVGSERAAAPQDAEQRWKALGEEKSKADREAARIGGQLEELRARWKAADAKVKKSQGADTKVLVAEKEDAERKLAQWAHSLPEQDFRSAEELQPELEKAQRAQTEAEMAERLAGETTGRLETELAAAKNAEACSHCGHKFTAAEKKKAIAKLNRELKAAGLDASLAKVKADNADAEAERLAALQTHAKEREKSKQEVESAMEAARTLIAQTEAKLATIGHMEADALEAAKLQREGAAMALQHSEALKKQATLANQLPEAEKGYKALLALRADASAKAAAAAEGRKVRIEVEVLKAACKLVAALQAELMQEAIGPLVKTMNQLCGSILPAPLEFRDGVLSTHNPEAGRSHSHKSMSGSQKLLAYAALSVALAAKAPVKLCLLDELGRLHPARKAKLVRHIVNLCQEGVLDQAVLVDVTCDPALGSLPEKWFKAIEVK